MIAIAITYLVCITLFVRTDTIIKDNPAQFNAVASDANGKSIPVSGEVDTIQVFDIHQLGQDLNDTGLKIDIGVSPLNGSNATANATRTAASAATTTTTPSPSVKLSDLRFPENVTTFSKVPALVPPDHPFTSPLNVSVPFSNGNNASNINNSAPNSTNSTSAYPPLSSPDQGEISRSFPFKFNPWWTADQQQSGSNNVSSFDASKSNQYSNMFGARPFFGQWGGQQGRAGGPRADPEPYPVNVGYRLNDARQLTTDDEKNQTSNGILGFLTELLPKTSKDRDLNIKGVDNSDYKSDSPQLARSSNADLSDKVDESIDPGMYTSNYLDPSRWNSFTNITFDEDGNTTTSEEKRGKSVEDDKNAKWNNPWLGKLPFEFASFNAFRISNDTPIWTVNVSSSNAARLFQQSPFDLSNRRFDGLNFTNLTTPPGSITPLSLLNPPIQFATNFPIPKMMMNFLKPPKKDAISVTTEQQPVAVGVSNVPVAADVNSSNVLGVLETVNRILKNLTDNLPIKGRDSDASDGDEDDASRTILKNWTAADRLWASKDFKMRDDEQNYINTMMNDDGVGDTNDTKSTNMADFSADPPNTLKGNSIDSSNGQSFILPPSSVSLLVMVCGGVLTGTIMFA